MNDEVEDWRWVDVDGVQKPIDEWELISSLSTGSLPAYTLVWRPGWAQWLPACQVAELASTIPDEQKKTPIEPGLEAGRNEPPPPPLEKHDRYRTRQVALQLVGSWRAPAAPTLSPPPPPLGTSATRRAAATAAASLIGKAASGPIAPPPPPTPARRPMPTLIDQPVAPASMTLRPPGAVPPPPRGVPARPRSSCVPEQPGPASPALTPPIPGIAIRDARREAQEAQEKAEHDDDAQQALAPPGPGTPAQPPPEQPTLPLASPGPPVAATDASNAPPSRNAEPDPGAHAASPAKPSVTAPPAPPVIGPAPPPPVGGPAPAAGSRFPVTLVAVGTLTALLGVVVIVLLATRPDRLTPLRTMDNNVAPTPTASRVKERGSCKLTRPARRLSPSILRSIPPYIAPTPDGSRLAIGVATNRTTALGLLLDPDTLSVARAFARNGRQPLLAVVPTTADGKLGFAVTRTDTSLANARTVDGKPRFVLGMSNAGFARVVAGGQPQVIWPGGTGKRMTEIRIATMPSGDHAVTFRRGGQSGKVLVGWIGASGARKSTLDPLEGGHFVGTPMVASNDSGILVVFATRDSRSAYWGVRLAAAADGKLPERSRDFTIPPGGAGTEAISPTAAGLDHDRWLLQWTEGSTGRREVRVQTMGSDMVPIGDPITVSPKDASAGQGVVWVRGRRAVSLFLVSTGKHLELWGAALTCQ